MAFNNFVRSAISSSTRTGAVYTKLAELVNELEKRENVLVQGWVQRSQTFGKKIFVKLNDGNSYHQVQAVVPRNVCETLHVGSAVRLRGNWLPSKGHEQKMEFMTEECLFVGQPTEIPVIGDCDTMRQLPHIRPKSKAFSAVLRLRSHLTHLIHNFFHKSSFFHIDLPMISQNDCEGAGEAFSIISEAKESFFGTGASQFLQVSTQLHLEAVANAIPRVYTLGPVFRADRGSVKTNMAEFRMLEVECAFVDSLDELCGFVENFLRFVVQAMHDDKHIGDEFRAYSEAAISTDSEQQEQCQLNDTPKKPHEKILFDYLTELLQHPLPRVSFAEAVKIVGRPVNDRLRPLNRQEELMLVDALNGPLFVTHFPAQQKPFYTRRTPVSAFGGTSQQSETTESFDLLVPQIGELAGGSVREWDVERLSERLPSESKLNWYIELRRRGHPRSAGFGLGIDRLMQALFGIPNIRDTIAFPRWYGHMYC